jgi:hypothetical protein
MTAPSLNRSSNQDHNTNSKKLQSGQTLPTHEARTTIPLTKMKLRLIIESVFIEYTLQQERSMTMETVALYIAVALGYLAATCLLAALFSLALFFAFVVCPNWLKAEREEMWRNSNNNPRNKGPDNTAQPR